jgi:hypothetical protein
LGYMTHACKSCFINKMCTTHALWSVIPVLLQLYYIDTVRVSSIVLLLLLLLLLYCCCLTILIVLSLSTAGCAAYNCRAALISRSHCTTVSTVTHCMPHRPQLKHSTAGNSTVMHPEVALLQHIIAANDTAPKHSSKHR